jgi:hypothetical protein
MFDADCIQKQQQEKDSHIELLSYDPHGERTNLPIRLKMKLPLGGTAEQPCVTRPQVAAIRTSAAAPTSPTSGNWGIEQKTILRLQLISR